MEKSILEESNICENVTLTIKETPISTPLPEFLTLIYTNNSDMEYTYGEGFRIEKKIGDDWYSIPNESSVLDIAYFLKPHSAAEVNCYILNLEDRIVPGIYRILCSVYKSAREIGDYRRSAPGEVVTYEFSIVETLND